MPAPRKPVGTPAVTGTTPGRVAPQKPKVKPADRSPNKVTPREAALAKQYAAVAKQARQKVDIKGGMSREQAKAIKDARAQLAVMKKKLAGKGYGSIDAQPNKKGGITSRNIYKDLTGKPLPPKKKPTKPAK